MGFPKIRGTFKGLLLGYYKGSFKGLEFPKIRRALFGGPYNKDPTT